MSDGSRRESPTAGNGRGKRARAGIWIRKRTWRLRGRTPMLARPIAAVLPPPPAPERPIFVIGCPRSGTTVLYRGLVLSGGLGPIQSENHALWEAYNHPKHHDWESNALTQDDVSERERSYIYRAIQLLSRGGRFVDKTPRNSLRVPYLDALFPDATYLFIKRRAPDNVNSLIEGWKAAPRYVSYRLPERLEGLGPLNGHDWSFTLIPGWRELRHAPLEEVCARQYVECNEAMLAARPLIAPERWVEIAYEDMVVRPQEELRRVTELLGLTYTDKLDRFAKELNVRPVNALTPPRPDKWRLQNPEAIERILPLVEPTERRLGYELASPAPPAEA